VRTSAGTPIGKVRIGSLPSTAHPLVTTLHRRLAERYPMVQLASGRARAPSSRLGSRRAASISRSCSALVRSPGMAIPTSSRHRPIS
jgi:hypothetical protein